MSKKASTLLSGYEANLVTVTFTKDASQELKQRILKECGAQYDNSIALWKFAFALLEYVKKVLHSP
jgi:superfamily I DNA/RNA helicase